MKLTNILSNLPKVAAFDLGGIYPGILQQEQNEANKVNVPQYGTKEVMADYEAGKKVGQKEFYDDPIMQEIAQKRREGMSGYDSATLGALRATARGETAGQQSQYLQQLRSKAARSGVGGARGLAVETGAREKFAGTTADQERKMMLDQAAEVNKGIDKFADYEMKRKYGAMGTGAGLAQMGVAQRTAGQQAAVANSGGGNCYVCTEIHKHEKFTLGQLKELMKMRKYVAEVNSKMIDIYDVEGPKLVASLNDKKITWAKLKPIVDEIITEWKSDKHLGAYLYVQFVKDLGVLAHD